MVESFSPRSLLKKIVSPPSFKQNAPFLLEVHWSCEPRVSCPVTLKCENIVSMTFPWFSFIILHLKIDLMRVLKAFTNVFWSSGVSVTSFLIMVFRSCAILVVMGEIVEVQCQIGMGGSLKLHFQTTKLLWFGFFFFFLTSEESSYLLSMSLAVKNKINTEEKYSMNLILIFSP